jgi:hypothetical protein
LFGGGIGLTNLFPGVTSGGVAGPRDEKEIFFLKKKREEIERLEQDIANERGKMAKVETEHIKRMEELREKHKSDLTAIEVSQKLTMDLLISEKEKTLEAHQEALARERLKLEVHH